MSPEHLPSMDHACSLDCPAGLTQRCWTKSASPIYIVPLFTLSEIRAGWDHRWRPVLCPLTQIHGRLRTKPLSDSMNPVLVGHPLSTDIRKDCKEHASGTITKLDFGSSR